MGSYFFSFDGRYDDEAAGKYFGPDAAELLAELARRYEALKPFDLAGTEATLNRLAEERDLKKAALIHPVRLAVTGVPRGPGLYEVLVTLGRPVVVERLHKAAAHIADRPSRP